MTPEQKQLVRTTFAQVAPIADTAATAFYDKLFARDPALRKLFADDLTEQKKKLMMMLATAVSNLDRWQTVAPAVQALGERHAGYGVKSGDYDTVGAALLETLEGGLGEAFTPAVREAWIACYGIVAGEMQGARKPRS